MQPFESHRVVRLAASWGVMGGVLVWLHFSHVHEATAALLGVSYVVASAALFPEEALATAVAAGVGFHFFFLPSPGLALRAPQHWLMLAAFAAAGTLTGWISKQSRQRHAELAQRAKELEMLYRLMNEVPDIGNSEFALPLLAARLVEILQAGGVAVFDKHSGEIVRAGAHAAAIPEPALLDAASNGRPFFDSTAGISITPIRYGHEFAGCVGIKGAELSQPILQAVAARAGMGLARLLVIESTMEAELTQRSEKLKGAVLDSLAHEIRAPLNSIRIAATALLSAKPSADPQQQELLTIIDEEVTRMDHFIEEAIQLARIEANELALKTAPNDLARLLPAAVEAMGPALLHRSVEVRVPDFLPPAECDGDMILHVLKQLLNNALKYSPPDSPLTVAAAFSGSAIVIDVIDTGPGVSEDERERIFEKYYRGRAARMGADGNGLGLASAKCIVEAHGGEIWVTGAPGGGAAFHVSLPAAAHPVGAL